MPGPNVPIRNASAAADDPVAARQVGGVQPKRLRRGFRRKPSLETPINTGPALSDDSVDENIDDNDIDDIDIDDDDVDLEVQSRDDFEDETQPHAEDGVPRNMSSLAINPVHPHAANLERELELTAAQAASLHFTGDFRDMDDAAIMLELKAGNMAGFDFLIQKYRRPIITFMYRMTRNQAIAEELAQEVFLRVYRSRETYRAEARFSTWLYRIATNLGVNQARDTRHERAASTVYLDETDSETGSTPDVADGAPTAEIRLLQEERLLAIREIVMELPERQRMGVLMHKYEGMDYKQIGEVLKLSESATKSLLFRAYQTLRDKLKSFV